MLPFTGARAAGKREAQVPFRSLVREGVLTSDDLDFLQDIYEAATAGMTAVDDASMHDIVRELIRHYQAGARDRYWLIMLAESCLHRAVG
jgi:hypothetical protein